MPRYKLTLEYDGTGFVGWQYQGDGRSVQEALERAVERFCGEQVRVHGAGRTDSGVHALGQCCHLDLARQAEPAVLRDALNAHLRPAPAVVLDAVEVHRPASMRGAMPRCGSISTGSSTARRRSRSRKTAPGIIARPLDAERHGGSRAPAGRHPRFHDLPRRQVPGGLPGPHPEEPRRLANRRRRSSFRAWARSFLHHQVRAMVGTLVEVGEGRRTPAEVGAALAACDRRRSGPTAPACGLYLEAVLYPPAP